MDDQTTNLALRCRARATFLESGTSDGVRSTIEASWRRSMLGGVAPDRPPAVTIDDIERDTRLIRAATPVLDRLAERLSDSSMSLMLCDADARILDRRVGVRSLQSQLDRVAAVPGAGFNEQVAGTNGLGTTLELRAPFIVQGAEHFAETLMNLTCAGAPIVNPLTGRLEGVVDMTCRASDGNELMLSFVCEAADEIQRRLFESASFAERALMEHFLAATRRSNVPVVSISSDFIVANAAAARLLDPEDHAMLWERASCATRGDGETREMVVVGKQAYLADVRPITHVGETVGAVVKLGRPPARRSARIPSERLSGLAGTSAAWTACCDAVRAAARECINAVVIGEPGVGKLAIARALHRLGGATTDLVEVDAAMTVLGETAWFEHVAAAIRDGHVLVRHLDLLSPAQSATLAALCDTATCRVLATAGDEWSATAPRLLVDRFPTRLSIPPLRQRPDDIPVVVAELVRRRTSRPDEIRFRPDALQLLRRHRWIGNVRELEGVVSQIVTRRPRGDVLVADLPVEYRSAHGDRHLTPMQRLERDAIVRALDEEHGNKNAAADRLGISRSTLYRKLEAYGVRPPLLIP